jgi:hypothetical protein
LSGKKAASLALS